jgi:sulfur-oxidizing protein SoxY
MNEVQDAPDHMRRNVLRGAAALAVLGLGAAGGAADADAAADTKAWPQEAFRQKSEADALKALYGKSPEPSDKIHLDAPEIAENGAVVPIAVSAGLPKVTGIAILVLDNPNTLAAAYTIPEGTEASVACRLKMAKTSKVVAVVQSDGRLYSAAKDVKVTVGGCGG